MEEKKRKASSSQKLWAVLLVADSFFVIIFGGALAATVYQHYYWQAPPAPRALASRHRVKPPVPIPAPPPEPSQAAAAKATPESQKPAAPAPAKTSGTAPKAVPVSFHYRASRAKSVYLAGAFLVHGGKRAMIRNSKGVWSLTIYLTPNSYRYYFIVNGKKRLDPANANSDKGESQITVP